MEGLRRVFRVYWGVQAGVVRPAGLAPVDHTGREALKSEGTKTAPGRGDVSTRIEVGLETFPFLKCHIENEEADDDLWNDQ